MMGRAFLALVLLPAAAILLSGCPLLSERECGDKCYDGIFYYGGDYVPLQGCIYDERPCETGRCDEYGHYCATPTPTPFTCENSYPACNGPCGNGTCRQPEHSEACACCGDGEIDQLAGEECETNADCPFMGTYGMQCINCECEEIYPTPVPTPTCGDNRTEGWEECENSTECSIGYYCYQCRCIVEEGPFPTPPREPTLPPATATPTPTPTPTPSLRNCGNGQTDYGEQCDVGAKFLNGRWYPAARDTCPSGKSCSSCVCIDREVTPRCGDCYISDAAHGGSEECDMGGTAYCHNNIADTCQSPLHCFNCRCAGAASPTPTEGWCGDGTVQAGEECERDSDCPLALYCIYCRCTQAPAQTPTPSEGYCGDGVRQGNEECEYDYQCPYGYACRSCACVLSGQPSPTPTPHEAYCGDGNCDNNEKMLYTEQGSGYQCTITSCARDCPSYPTSIVNCQRDCGTYCSGWGSVQSNVASCDYPFYLRCTPPQNACCYDCIYKKYAEMGGCCCGHHYSGTGPLNGCDTGTLCPQHKPA